ARWQVGEQAGQLTAVARVQGGLHAVHEGLVGQPTLDEFVPELADRVIPLRVGGAERFGRSGRVRRRPSHEWSIGTIGPQGQRLRRTVDQYKRTRGSSTPYRMSTTRFAMTTKVAARIVTPRMTGKSCRLIAWMTVQPSPVTPKRVSTMMTPPSAVPMSRPARVTTGVSAARSACRPMTRFSFMPLDRAVLM